MSSAPLNSTVRPLVRVAISSLLAAMLPLFIMVGIGLLDVSLNQSLAAGDAASKGAIALPFIYLALLAIFFGIGRVLRSASPVTYTKAFKLMATTAVVLVAIPAAVSVLYSNSPLLRASTYLPWTAGYVVLILVLFPGSLLQVWLLRSRPNKSLERTRDE